MSKVFQALVRLLQVSRFELRVGWRYLYGGRRDRVMAMCALGSLAITAMAGVSLLASSGANPLAVILVVVGMIITSLFGLLALFSVFTTVSVLGVALGVTALTIVLAVTTGFEAQFREKVLGVNAHVIIQKSQSTFAEYRDVMAKARTIDPDVLAVQPFIFAEMLVTRGKGHLSGVAIKGIDPELVGSVLDLQKHMIEGSVASLGEDGATASDGVPGGGDPAVGDGASGDASGAGASGAGASGDAGAAPAETGAERLPAIIMGKELAHKLRAKVGDVVTVVVPLSNIDFDTWRAKSSAPRTRKFRVTGVFYSGFDEYDRRLMYTALRHTQELVGRGDQVMGVELKVKDVDRAAAIARKLEQRLGGPPYQVEDWYELNHNLFTALRIQKAVLVVILTLIIAVAAFNMVSALTMMVTDKTRDIAILKSMGTQNVSIAAIFQVMGLAIGGVGTVLGVIIGITTAVVVRGYGYHLDPKVYLIDRLPIELRPLEVLLVIGVTMGISLIATIGPALSGSSLRPVDGLRYD
jgi:lipoprotein-releasing system permease protein